MKTVFVHLLLLWTIPRNFSTSDFENPENFEELDDNYATDFDRTLIELNHVFVDKTMFIVRALQEELPVEHLFRGRGWGKTFNLNMLEVFFDIRHDDNGTIVPWTQRDIYFKGGKLRYRVHPRKKYWEIIDIDPLEVSKYPDVMDHMGRHPVIYLSFRDCGTSYEIFLNSTIDKISSIIEGKNYANFLTQYCADLSVYSEGCEDIKNDFIVRSYTVDVSKLQCEQLLQNPREVLTDESLLEKSLFILFNLLTEHFDEQTLILIDDCDHSLQDMIDDENDFNRTEAFLRRFLEYTFPNQGQHSLKGFVTGSLRCYGTEMHSEKFFDKLKPTSLPNSYPEDFGLTKYEIQSILDKHWYNVTLQDLESWYGGFDFQGEKMFNPNSVINCLLSDGSYRANLYYGSKMLNNIMLADDLQEDFQKLYFGNIKTQRLGSDVDMRIVNLVNFGYLSAAGIEKPNTLSRFKQPDFDYEISIPNRECRDFFRAYIEIWAAHKLRLPEVKLICEDGTIRQSYKQGNILAVKKLLNIEILPKINVFDNHCDAIFAMILALDGPWILNRTFPGFDSGFLDCAIVLSPKKDDEIGPFFIAVKSTDEARDKIEETSWKKMFRLKTISHLVNTFSQFENANSKYITDLALNNLKTFFTYISDRGIISPYFVRGYHEKDLTRWRVFVKVYQIDKQKREKQMIILSKYYASRHTTRKVPKVEKLISKLWYLYATPTSTTKLVLKPYEDRSNSIYSV